MAKHELPAINTLPPLPEKPEDRRILKQAEISVDLWAEVQKERDRQGLTTRDIFEYGLKCFLAASKNRK